MLRWQIGSNQSAWTVSNSATFISNHKASFALKCGWHVWPLNFSSSSGLNSSQGRPSQAGTAGDFQCHAMAREWHFKPSYQEGKISKSYPASSPVIKSRDSDFSGETGISGMQLSCHRRSVLLIWSLMKWQSRRLWVPTVYSLLQRQTFQVWEQPCQGFWSPLPSKWSLGIRK